MQGGYDGTYLTDVLQYEAETDQWIGVGELSTGRAEHAISAVPGNIADYC